MSENQEGLCLPDGKELETNTHNNYDVCLISSESSDLRNEKTKEEEEYKVQLLKDWFQTKLGYYRSLSAACAGPLFYSLSYISPKANLFFPRFSPFCMMMVGDAVGILTIKCIMTETQAKNRDIHLIRREARTYLKKTVDKCLFQLGCIIMLRIIHFAIKKKSPSSTEEITNYHYWCEATGILSYLVYLGLRKIKQKLGYKNSEIIWTSSKNTCV